MPDTKTGTWSVSNEGDACMGRLEQLIQSYEAPSTADILNLFRFQAQFNPVYSAYLKALRHRPQEILKVDEIPCMPVTFFRNYRVKSWRYKSEVIWHSSTTTSQRPSRHYVQSLSRFHLISRRIFEFHYGPCRDWIFIALLPSYLERRCSGLVSMVDGLMSASDHPLNGFFLYDHHALAERYHLACNTDRKIMLIGVGFALMDLAARQSIVMRKQDVVMETGGMKGRGPELVREALHDQLCAGLKTDGIHTEYGMTELSSSSYAKGFGRLTPPPWMKVRIQDLHDPLEQVATGKTGTIDIIDFANIHSCSFIKTDDLGWTDEHGDFFVLGRRDESEWRGCNLLYQPN
ncbi:MAG: acyl transferase [Bacteroidia bacterium]